MSRSPATCSAPALAATAVLAALAPLASSLVQHWRDDSNYHFVPLVALIATGLLVKRLRAQPDAQTPAWTPGLALLATAVAALWLGVRGDVMFLQRLAVVPALLGCVALTAGRQSLIASLLPALLLAICIPLPDGLSAEASLDLRLAATTLTDGALRLLGLPAVIEGTVLRIGSSELQIVSGCSGIRSIAAISAISLTLVTLRERSRSHSFLLCGLAILVVLIANVFRLTSLGLLVGAGQLGLAEQAHGIGGMTNIMVGAVVLLGMDALLARWLPARSADSNARTSRATHGIRPIRGAAVCVATAALLLSIQLTTPSEFQLSGTEHATPPMEIGELLGTDSAAIDELFTRLECSDSLYRIYAREGQPAFRVAAFGYARSSLESELFAHPPRGCYRATGWRVLADETLPADAARGLAFPVTRLELVHSQTRERRRAYCYYQLGRRGFARPLPCALTSFTEHLLGAPHQGRLWVVSTMSPPTADSDAELDFVAALQQAARPSIAQLR